MHRLCRSTKAALLFLFAAPAFPQLASAQVRELSELSATDIQSLDRDQTVVIIPGGVMEEHGPYLPAFTDGYSNAWVAARVAETVVAKTGRPVVMFPLIPLGVGTPEDFGGRALFSGWYTIRPSTMRAIYMDLATALGNDGFRWIFVVNRHGAPSHSRAMLEASEYFRDVFKGTMIGLSSYRYSAVADREPILSSDEARENAGDVHAGADETSRMLFLKPELVHKEYGAALPQSASTIDDLPNLAAVPSWPGYFGSPRLARADIGAEVLRRMVEDYGDLALKVLDGFDPRGLPNSGDAGNGALKVLDDNVVRRSDAIEQQERDWLAGRGLR